MTLSDTEGIGPGDRSPHRCESHMPEASRRPASTCATRDSGCRTLYNTRRRTGGCRKSFSPGKPVCRVFRQTRRTRLRDGCARNGSPVKQTPRKVRKALHGRPSCTCGRNFQTRGHTAARRVGEGLSTARACQPSGLAGPLLPRPRSAASCHRHSGHHGRQGPGGKCRTRLGGMAARSCACRS